MEQLQVIFARNWLPLSLAIQIRTLSKWSHVGVVIGDNVIESRGGVGVVITSLNEFKDRYTSTDIGLLPCVSKQVAEDFLYTQVGKKYDLKAIIGAAFNLKIDSSVAYHCSELIAEATGLFNPNYLSTVSPAILRKMTV